MNSWRREGIRARNVTHMCKALEFEPQQGMPTPAPYIHMAICEPNINKKEEDWDWRESTEGGLLALHAANLDFIPSSAYEVLPGVITRCDTWS